MYTLVGALVEGPTVLKAECFEGVKDRTEADLVPIKGPHGIGRP